MRRPSGFASFRGTPEGGGSPAGHSHEPTRYPVQPQAWGSPAAVSIEAAVSIAAAVTVQAQAGYGRGREARPRAGCSRRRGEISEGAAGFTACQGTVGSFSFELSFLLSSRSFGPRSCAFWLFWVPAVLPSGSSARPFSRSSSCGSPLCRLSRSFSPALSRSRVLRAPGPQVSRALVSRLFSCEVNRPRQWTEGRCPSAKQVSSVERGSRRAPSEKPSIPE